MSKVIPLVSPLHRAAAAIEHQGRSLSAQLALQIQRRFCGIETCHSIAASTSLDVRFKNLAFRDNVENVKKRLLTEMQETYQLTSVILPQHVSQVLPLHLGQALPHQGVLHLLPALPK